MAEGPGRLKPFGPPVRITAGRPSAPPPNGTTLPAARVQPGESPRPSRAGGQVPGQDSYLVDSASSHMLVSKIKPCMSKYKQSIR